MGLPQPKQQFTPEEYLRRERDALDKHEFFRGEIFAMAGGSAEHSRIIANVIRQLGNRLDRSPCAVFDSNLRIRVSQNVPLHLPRRQRHLWPSRV